MSVVHRSLLVTCALLSCLALGRAFYLPNLANIFSKKTPCGASALSSLWGGGGGGGGCGGGVQGVRNYFQYETPPMPLPYPAPLPPQPQVGATPQGLSAGLQGGYGNSQFVPCICSVSQDDIEDAGKLLTQQQAAKKLGGAK